MERYKNLSGMGGVNAFELNKDSIIIQFKTGETYRYNYETPGERDVEDMKRLAQEGRGLTTFINTNVRDRYASKLS